MIPHWMYRLSLAVLLILGVRESHGEALPPAPPARRLFKSFGPQQGLDNLAVTTLHQDPEGFLWVGTQGNLFRFEGQRFQSFGLREGLPSGYITTLASAPGKGLWVGTWTGLAHLEGGVFRSVPLPGPQGSPHIHSMSFDPQGTLWIASTSGAFAMGQDGTITPLRGATDEATLAIQPSSRGTWLAVGPKVLLLDAGGKWHQPTPNPSPEGEDIQDLLVHPDGRVFARSFTRIWVLKPGAGSFIRLDSPYPTNTQNAARCFLGPDGTVWAPTEEGLLAIRGESISQLGPRQGLPTSSPWAVLTDHEGSLWVAGQGIHRDLGNGAWHAYTTQEGLPHDQVWTVFRDSRKRLWVGTNLGLALGGPRGWKRIPATHGQAIRSLVEGPDGLLWAGTAKGEILLLDPEGGLRQRLGPRNGLLAHKLLSLSVNTEGVWAGSDGDGLFRITRHGGRWVANRESPGEHGPERVSQVLVDRQDRLWVATEHGIALRKGGTWRLFDTSCGLLQNHVSYLNLSRDGTLQVAYFEPLGVSRFKVDASGTLTLIDHWNSSGRLSSDTPYLLGDDALGRLWIGGSRGLDVFREGSRRHFGSLHGLVGEDCDATAFLGDPDGQVWVGTSTGLAHYIGRGQEGPEIPPSVLLVSAQLGDKSLTLGSTEPEFGHRDNALSLRLAGSSFIQADHLEYAYRLNSEDAWAWKTTRSRELYIPALPPGSHELELRCRMDQGEWGAVTTLRFLIRAAWWQWWWLRGLGIAMVLGLLARLIYWRVGYLKQRNAELEALLQLSDTLARELETANLNLQEQTLTDPLTGLKNRRFLNAIIARDLAEVERRRREDPPTSPNVDLLFLIIDIDHFKSVNDRHGHQAGDQVLHQFAGILKAATRGSDTVIRYGGEEFLVLARQSRREDAIVLAERIRISVENRPFMLPSGVRLACTCSIGFAPYPVDERDLQAVPWDSVLALADQCLYQAKDEGRNRWLGLLPGPQTLERSPGEIPKALDALLHEGFLQLVSSQSKAPCGAQVER